MRARRRSGISPTASAASNSSTRICNSPVAASPLRRRRATSIIFRRAAVSSHASELEGRPFRSQSASAEANAPERASSADATSRATACNAPSPVGAGVCAHIYDFGFFLYRLFRCHDLNCTATSLLDCAQFTPSAHSTGRPFHCRRRASLLTSGSTSL